MLVQGVPCVCRPHLYLGVVSIADGTWKDEVRLHLGSESNPTILNETAAANPAVVHPGGGGRERQGRCADRVAPILGL